MTTTNYPDVLCLSASPHLQMFDRPLLKCLAQHTTIAQWQYHQTPDEPCSLEVALGLLHHYLNPPVEEAAAQEMHPIHLIGHGTSGLLALLYAQRQPERVRSLTLLSVGAYPAIDWQMHYYAQRNLLPCSRQAILARMVETLFGNTPKSMVKGLVRLLEQDLDLSLSPHSLIKQVSLPPIQVSLPLLVCGSVDDVIVDPQQLRSWQQYCNEDAEARLWVCPGGRHFFHYFYPQQVADEILCFWRAAELARSPLPNGCGRFTPAVAQPSSASQPPIISTAAE
jgi:surfactin synthase thioesterase subunit